MAENKKVGVKYTDAELAKMTKEDREDILNARKAVKARIEKNANASIDDLETASITERECASKFKKIYEYVRKGLVILRAKKISKKMTNSEVLAKTYELFEKAQNL